MPGTDAFRLERLAAADGSMSGSLDAESFHQRLAIIDGTTAWTYADLDAAANRVANGLLADGLGEGDRVAFVGRSGCTALATLLGCARAGVVCALLNWRLRPHEVGATLADSQASVLIATDEQATQLDTFVEGSEVKRVLIAGSPGGAWESWLGAQGSQRPRFVPPADDVAIQLYTSGTTGLPKGVLLTRAGVAITIADAVEIWEMGGRSVMLSILPMFHIAGIAAALATFWAGGCLLIGSDPSPTGIAAAVAEHAATNIVLVSPLLTELVCRPGFDLADLASMRTISYGAAPMPERTLQAATTSLSCRLVQIYGLTESTGALTALQPSDHHFPPGDERARERIRSVGKPRPGVELRVVDSATGEALPAGQVGEIQARTARAMRGYWNREQANEQAFVDGWLRTGDLGELDDGGYLYLRDRLRDMIISGGENIYPTEVEEVLAGHPSVAEVAVIAVPHERFGETPRAVVVLGAGEEVSASALIDYARDRLAHYKCPTSVAFRMSLPKNATGKVLRRDLREAPRTSEGST